jgi:hypothetical protein
MSNQTDPRIQKTLDDIQAKFEKRLNEIKSDGESRIKEISDETPNPNGTEVAFDTTFDVYFKNTSIKFDIPKFSTELQKIIFDIPSVKMTTKALSWDVPATKMETRCIAKKPVWVQKGPSVTIKYKCIYMDVPVGYTKRMEIKIDMPEFSMKRQEISFDKPIIKFETIEIILKLPQFHFREVSADLKENEDDFKEVGKEMESQIAVAKSEMDQSLIGEVNEQVETIFEDIRKQLLDQREIVSSQFDDAIGKMKTTIKILKENNAVNEIPKLEGELSKLVDDYKVVLNEIDSSIDQLNKEQLEVINSIKFQ